MKMLIASAIFLLMLISVEPASSHSGGTDSCGCHTNHQTGDYHCHNRKVCDDDDNGCAIAGAEDTDGNILLNLLFIGLNAFSPLDP